jgi:hypothetical protein
VNYVVKRLNSSFYALLQLKKTFDSKSLLDVYYAMVHSVLSYNVVLWGDSTETVRVFVAQKRILRLIFELKRVDSCRPLFKENKILTFPSIYIYGCITHIKKHMTEFQTNSQNHRYPTRMGNLIKTEQHKTVTFEKSPSFAGSKFFNCLPSYLKHIVNLNLFKTKLRDYLIAGTFYSIEEFLQCSKNCEGSM